MIYLDNSATTHKKPLKTIFNVIKALTIYNANPSRSSHKLSIKVGEKVEDCREHLKSFFNATQNSTVVYTYNCTEALNYAILGLLKENDHVVITTFEHNSVIRPLNSLKKINVSYSVAEPNNYGAITLEEIKKCVKQNTKLIIVNHTSNVTGTTTSLKEIGNYAKENNITFLVDCAQSAGHEIIDMKNFNINLIAIAGHKGLFGPQGIGALIIDEKTNLNCIKFGGSGSNSLSPNMPDYLPDKLEAGTINTVGILGLDGGISFVEKNFNKINAKTCKLTKYLLENLKQNSNVILYSNNTHSGVVSFNIKNIDTQDVINYLNNKNICVRGGLHCAPLSHKYLKTESSGLVRVSISYFNNIFEIKKLIKTINKLTSNIKK